MIAAFELRGKIVHSKVVKENAKTVDVMVPKVCKGCNGSGVVTEKMMAWDRVQKKHCRPVWRRVACAMCWGEPPGWRSIKLRKKDCELMNTVRMSFPSPSYWCPPSTEGANY